MKELFRKCEQSDRMELKEYFIFICVLMSVVTEVYPQISMSGPFDLNNCIISNISVLCKEWTGSLDLPDSHMQVEVLSILDSDLRTLGPKNFYPVLHLKTLYIEDCLIYDTSKESFLYDLKDLRNLHVIHSDLSNNFTNIFRNNFKLRKLSLVGNNITAINNAAFTPLQYVESIDLSYNEISIIESSSFGSLVSLKELNLAHNRIGEDFDPSYLPRESGEKCPEGDLQRCEGNRAVDDLWRALRAKDVAVYLDGNPVCSRIKDYPDDGQSAQSVAAAGSAPESPGDCAPHLQSRCRQVQRRRTFLQEACAGDRKRNESPPSAPGDVEEQKLQLRSAAVYIGSAGEQDAPGGASEQSASAHWLWTLPIVANMVLYVGVACFVYSKMEIRLRSYSPEDDDDIPLQISSCGPEIVSSHQRDAGHIQLQEGCPCNLQLPSPWSSDEHLRQRSPIGAFPTEAQFAENYNIEQLLVCVQSTLLRIPQESHFSLEAKSYIVYTYVGPSSMYRPA